MMKRLLRISVVLLMLVIFAMPAIPVFAIAAPLAVPQVRNIFVYESVLETGDRGVLIDYYVNQAAAYPIATGETATQSYIFVFVEADGVTQRKAAAPYAWASNARYGYERGLVWIYFTAAEAATAPIIDSAFAASYRIWFQGNPGLTWVPVTPPKTVGSGIVWQTTGDPHVIIAQRLLSLAAELELAWALDMVSTTALGTRLTTTGEDYFNNVIPNLRTIAPNVFAAGTISPTPVDLNYNTSFGATIVNGTGTGYPAPPTGLTSGLNNLDATHAGGVAGTFTLVLNKGTSGTADSIAGRGIVTGSPAPLRAGTNTIIVTPTGANGEFTVTVALQNTQTKLRTPDTLATIVNGTGTGYPAPPTTLVAGVNNLTATGTGTFTLTLGGDTTGLAHSVGGGCTITSSPVKLVNGVNTIFVTVGGTNAFTVTLSGSGFDLTVPAAVFGVSPLTFSGLVWLLLSIVICAAVYKTGSEQAEAYGGAGNGKVVMLVFQLCIIGGALLGLLHPIVAALLFICWGAFIGYVLFFRGANI